MARLGAIATLLQKGQLGFEQFQDVTIVAHRKESKVQIAQAEQKGRDLCH
jgi:hypothetical protein